MKKAPLATSSPASGAVPSLWVEHLAPCKIAGAADKKRALKRAGTLSLSFPTLTHAKMLLFVIGTQTISAKYYGCGHSINLPNGALRFVNF
jgi:hypothetical protein